MFSRDGTFVIKCHCTFPRVSDIRHNKPLGSSSLVPIQSCTAFLIYQKLVAWQCSGKDLALWQSSPWECWQVRHQYLHSHETLKHSMWLLCVAKAKVLRETEVSFAGSTGEASWLQTWAFQRYRCSYCSSATSVSDPFCAFSALEIASNKGKRW